MMAIPFNKSPTFLNVMDTLWGDFTSIRTEGDYLIFIDQSTQRIVARVPYANIEMIENGDIWKGDV